MPHSSVGKDLKQLFAWITAIVWYPRCAREELPTNAAMPGGMHVDLAVHRLARAFVRNWSEFYAVQLSSPSQLLQLPEFVKKSTRLQALMIDTPGLWGIPMWIRDVASLRVLACLSVPNLVMVPPQVGRLEHLRMLALVGARIAELPASLGRLAELRVLDLKGCDRLESIPDLAGCAELELVDVTGCTALLAADASDSGLAPLYARGVVAADGVFIDADGAPLGACPPRRHETYDIQGFLDNDV